MAASKDTRTSGCEPSPFFLELFRDLSDSGSRKRTWHTAMARTGEGAPPLGFPAYKSLYLITVHASKLVVLLEETSGRFGIDHESVAFRKSSIKLVPLAALQSIAGRMNDVEITEQWLFERQRLNKESKLPDPDDVYISLRRHEGERIGQGLPRASSSWKALCL